LSVIEAMALGLGVVSTNVGGMPFLIDDGVEGLLVPSGDAEAMAEALVKMIKEIPAFAGMTKAARKKVEQFDWEVVKKQWEELLEGVVSS
jgi:glycosyltransferase involved in cell wall biosynthesis